MPGRSVDAIRQAVRRFRDDLPDRVDPTLLRWADELRVPHVPAAVAGRMGVCRNTVYYRKRIMRAAGFDVWPFEPIYHKHNEGD